MLWQIKISMEYPLRPPVFTLNLYTMNSEENCEESDDSDWYNELRAMEAEVREESLFHISELHHLLVLKALN